MNILLDYFFPITAVSPTPAASTAFLKQACIVVKPSGSPMTAPLLCTSMAAVAAVTANAEAQQLFDAGMGRVYVLAVSDLDIATELLGHESDFYTLIVSSDFVDADIDQVKASGNVTITSYANLISGTADVVTVCGQAFTAQSAAVVAGAATFRAATSNDATGASLAAQINAHAVTAAKVTAVNVSGVVTITALSNGAAQNALTLAYTDNDTNVGATKSGTTLSGGAGLEVGAFKGVVGISSTDDTKNASRAATENWAAFHTTSGNKAKNMCYAFGKLLSNALAWSNQQYITMPYADDVATLGAANALFDSKVNFVLSDTEFGSRLGLFSAGGKAIAAPYIVKNLELDMQSAALTYISGNQPAYSHKQAALLEDELQKVIQGYIDDQEIEAGVIEVKLEEDNFVASGYSNISEPKALWRIFGEMKQTL